MLRRMLALVLSGILITTQNGTELAREAWRDDGITVKSDISGRGKKMTLAIDRQQHKLHIQQGDDKTEVDIPDGAAALMNLNWAAYPVLADRFKQATTPTPFKAILGPDRVIEATVTVKPGPAGGREVTVAVAALDVHVTIDKAGAVTSASVPAQGIEVRPAAAASAPMVTRAPPAGVVEERFEIDNHGAKLAGILWLPAVRPRKVPVVLFIAGSGPVDRDGNAGGLMRSDSYRLLAEALAKKGIASIRYDKRGAGQSTLGKKLEELGFDDYVSDAAALLTMARVNDKLAGVYVFGHSEGALVALELAATTKIDGIITAAGAGRPVADVAREQYAKQLPAAEMREYDQLLAALKAHKPLDPKSTALAMLFQPALAKFLGGMLLTDPRPLAAAYKGTLTVVQGDNDIQVTVDRDARPLAAAHPGAKLVVLKGVSHLLKHDEHKGADQPSYRDPSLPIDPGVVDAVVATIR
jgi:pimeloyl-ACP methyl ester carboxylesterase